VAGRRFANIFRHVGHPKPSPRAIAFGDLIAFPRRSQAALCRVQIASEPTALRHLSPQ
jgi:hypothetical protein